jgi:hypothetical protein
MNETRTETSPPSATPDLTQPTPRELRHSFVRFPSCSWYGSTGCPRGRRLRYPQRALCCRIWLYGVKGAACGGAPESRRTHRALRSDPRRCARPGGPCSVAARPEGHRQPGGTRRRQRHDQSDPRSHTRYLGTLAARRGAAAVIRLLRQVPGIVLCLLVGIKAPGGTTAGSRRHPRLCRGHSACGDTPIITNPRAPRDREVAHERGMPDNRIQLPR